MKKSSAKIRSFFLISFLVILGGWYYTRQTLFRLSNIEVLTENDGVRSLILKHMAAHLGRNLFAISLKDVERELLSIKRIDHLTIKKAWPSGIKIQAELRKPVAVLKVDNKEFFVDSKGVLFAESNGELGLLPRILNFKSDARRLKLLNWLGQEKTNDVFNKSLRIESFSWDDELGVIAQSLDGTRIEIGFDDFESAWMRAIKTLEYLQKNEIHAAALDATYNNRVVVKKPSKLQNPKNDLNLKEMVHREGGQP